MSQPRIHLSFFRAAGLCAAAAALLAASRHFGANTAETQVAMPAIAAWALAGCGAWYRANPTRAIGEAASGHAALAVPGAIVTSLGAVGLGAGMEIATPALAIGAIAVGAAFLMMLGRAFAPKRRVRRIVSTAAAPDGSPVTRIDYVLDR
ncbi:hypothetical protein [Blastochloris viridis]|uniref:Transmembrane protein n=1 Tax=Blastochloris viridis TaxID=1079 RepID=A0A0H5BQ97_BLAVI|nr:hypothetical protein [Blastochloris viridis]ALK09543.1 hypothetical protein BVIR_1769 [Blastochloris viridis]BAS00569.1 hypothetical protein BV133_2975 [Blastochloris viridis]CUU42206.1 hypothetical protein BVIRIDIS_12140 [Blastochloris viridis]